MRLAVKVTDTRKGPLRQVSVFGKRVFLSITLAGLMTLEGSKYREQKMLSEENAFLFILVQFWRQKVAEIWYFWWHFRYDSSI